VYSRITLISPLICTHIATATLCLAANPNLKPSPSSPLILRLLSTQVWQTHGRKKYGIFYLRVGLVRMINPLKSNAHNGDSPRSRISALALDGGLRLSRRSETSISAQSQANLR